MVGQVRNPKGRRGSKTNNTPWSNPTLTQRAEEQARRLAAAPLTSVDSNCQHHWKIEIPEGPTSLGVCLKCKGRRHFQNSLREYKEKGVYGRKKKELYVYSTAKNLYP